MTADTWRDQIAATFEIHQLEWIDHDVGWECGCNEYGDLPGMRFLQDALRHQADAVIPILDAAMAQQAEEIAQAIWADQSEHWQARQRHADIARNAGSQP